MTQSPAIEKMCLQVALSKSSRHLCQALTWDQIDLDGRELRVVARYRQGRDWRSRISDQPAHGATTRCLGEVAARRVQGEPAQGRRRAGVRHRPGQSREPLRRAQSRPAPPALAEAKIARNFTLDDLRHTFAPSLIRAGIDVLRVARMLGHASPDITLRVYGHLIQQGRDDSAEKLQAVMLGATCNGSVTAPMAMG